MTDLHSKERVTDEVLAERIEAAQGLLSAGYPSRTMRETLLIAIELQERRAGETTAEHTIPCPMCKTPLAARRLDYKCKLCFGTVVFGDSICPITGALHEALPEKTGADPHG